MDRVAPTSDAQGTNTTEARSSLYRRLANEVRAMILEGRYAPGERIAELDLCSAFNVSRTPLREALRVLASEGLVDLLPNRGARVVSLTLDEVRDLFGVMSVLNGYAGELAAGQLGEAELDQMRDLHLRMIAAFEARDLAGYSGLNKKFHDIILIGSGNAALFETNRTISGRISISRYQANFSRRRWSEALSEHEAMLKLFRIRRGHELSILLRAHIMNKFESIREAAAKS
jgi:DNA-binding GntR family transcriptional regulator